MIVDFVFKEFRQNRWKVIIITAILIILALVLPLSYNLLHKTMLEFAGEAELEVNGVSLFENNDVYLWHSWGGENLYSIGIIAALLLGVYAVAGEVKKGTIDFLLSRPISRRKLFMMKVTSGLGLLFFILLLPTILLLITARFKLGEISIGLHLVNMLIVFSGLSVVYLLGVLLSVIFPHPLKAAGISSLLLVIYYLFFRFALGVTTLFEYMVAEQYIFEGRFPLSGLLVCLAVLVVMYVAGLRKFTAKEFKGE